MLELTIERHVFLYFFDFWLFRMQYRRRQGQTKKQLYRRFAEIKKQIWMRQHPQNEDQNFKSHFISQQEQSNHDSTKSKKITKIQYRTQQRLRNRVAAQESRERHRQYVQELERKLKIYEQLLNSEGGLCRNCKKSVLLDVEDMENQVKEEMSLPSESSGVPSDMVSQEGFLNSLLQDQTIRIDNNGAATPFGIFFIVCIVAVLTIFSFNTQQQVMAPRLLTNYHSSLSDLMHSHPEKGLHDGIKDYHKSSRLQELSLPSVRHKTSKQSDTDSKLDQLTSGSQLASDKIWTKYGKYVCSEPELLKNRSVIKEQKSPEFLLLRTGRNSTKMQKNQEADDDDNNDTSEQNSFQILPHEWQKVQISSCFLGQI